MAKSNMSNTFSVSLAVSRPLSVNMADYDLTSKLGPFLDRHLVFPLMEFLSVKGVSRGGDGARYNTPKHRLWGLVGAGRGRGWAACGSLDRRPGEGKCCPRDV